MPLIRWSKETGIQTQSRDESGRVGKGRSQCMNGKAAIADKDDFAARQPAAKLQDALPCPIGQQLVLSALFLIMALRGTQDRQHRQGLNTFCPWDRGKNHEAQPSQAAGFDEVPMAGAHWVTTNSTSGDTLASTPFDCIVHADHDGPLGREPGNNDGQQTGRERPGVPAGSVEELMIGGKIAYPRAPGDAQAGRHRSLAKRKERTHHQDQQMLPAWRGKPETKRRQPFAKDVGDRVSRLTATIMLFAHPSVRIRSNEWRKAGTLRRIDSPRLLRCPRNHHRFCTKSS